FVLFLLEPKGDALEVGALIPVCRGFVFPAGRRPSQAFFFFPWLVRFSWFLPDPLRWRYCLGTAILCRHTLRECVSPLPGAADHLQRDPATIRRDPTSLEHLHGVLSGGAAGRLWLHAQRQHLPQDPPADPPARRPVVPAVP